MGTEITQQPHGMRTGLALPSFSGEEVDGNWPKGGGVGYGGCPGRARGRLPPRCLESILLSRREGIREAGGTSCPNHCY